MIDLKSKNLKEIEILMTENRFPKFRAKQILGWIYKGVKTFDDMKNLPKDLISFLNENAVIELVRPEQKLVSKIDGTVKYLFRLQDDNFIESVVMQYHHGYTICISSQVGCRMGCAFCQSTEGGKIRDLSAGEILDQIIFASTDLGITIHNVVMMGIGEPLDNYDNVLRFLKLINSPDGLGVGYRHISVSTCGVVPGIEKLKSENLPITLSISLHAPNDEIRSSMMPINKKYNIATLLDACRKYQAITGRRISFEYTLVNGVNDSMQCAEQLAGILKGIMCHVNLIPVNKIEKGLYDASERKAVLAFQKKLNDLGLNATIRRTLGSDISASCGQLRSKQLRKEG